MDGRNGADGIPATLFAVVEFKHEQETASTLCRRVTAPPVMVRRLTRRSATRTAAVSWRSLIDLDEQRTCTNQAMMADATNVFIL